MKLHPAGYRVLVKLKQIDEVKGKIEIPSHIQDAHKRATQEAYVIEIGHCAWKAIHDGEPWCKVDDLVLIAKYSGEDRIDKATGDIYRIINDEDIFAIVEE